MSIRLFAPHGHIPSHCGGIPRAKNAEHTNKCQDINPTWSILIPKVLNLHFHWNLDWTPNQTFNFTENCCFSQHLAISIPDSLDRPLHLRSRWTSEVFEDLHPFLLVASVSRALLRETLEFLLKPGLHSKILYIRTALKIYTDYIHDIQWYSLNFKVETL